MPVKNTAYRLLIQFVEASMYADWKPYQQVAATRAALRLYLGTAYFDLNANVSMLTP